MTFARRVTAAARRRLRRPPTVPLAPLLAGIPLAAAIMGCAVVQRAPLQMARFAQLESYRQTFVVPGTGEADENRRLDSIFDNLLGPRNWQTLKDLYGLDALRNELISEGIYLRGLLNFMVYVDPSDYDAFVIEGLGRFFLIRQRTGGILLSGDFYVPTQHYSRADLHTGCSSGAADSSGGCVLVDVELFQTRYPNQLTYHHAAAVAYAMWIDTSHRDDNYYAVDYDRRHRVYLDMDRDDVLGPSEVIGHLRFDMPRGGPMTKLFDFRGTEFLRRYR